MNVIYFTTEIRILNHFLFVFPLLELKPRTVVCDWCARPFSFSGLWGPPSECVHVCIERAPVSLRNSFWRCLTQRPLGTSLHGEVEGRHHRSPFSPSVSWIHWVLLASVCSPGTATPFLSVVAWLLAPWCVETAVETALRIEERTASYERWWLASKLGFRGWGEGHVDTAWRIKVWRRHWGQNTPEHLAEASKLILNCWSSGSHWVELKDNSNWLPKDH